MNRTEEVTAIGAIVNCLDAIPLPILFKALENIRIAIHEFLEAQPEIEARFGTKIYREEITL